MIVVASLSGVPQSCRTPLQTDDNENKKERKKKKDRFYIYTDGTHTHTHPAGAGPTLKEKSGHKRRAKGQKQRREGEGNERISRTNIRGETDLTGTGYTPQPHDTLQRGTGEELGTEWGTSW